MKTIKLTLALLAFAICMGSCAMILGIDKGVMMSVQKGMSQKEFAQRTGIAESSISDWKKKRTNPVSDKILIICEVLDVTPYELLSGAEHTGNRSRDNNTYVISKDTEIGMLVETYQKLNTDAQKRVMGYLEALRELT